MSGCQPADSSSDDHQIIVFAAFDGLADALLESSVAQAMRDLERTRMTAQACLDGRIIALLVLRFGRIRRSQALATGSIAAPITIAAPCMKSRRVSGRSIPKY